MHIACIRFFRQPVGLLDSAVRDVDSLVIQRKVVPSQSPFSPAALTTPERRQAWYAGLAVLLGLAVLEPAGGVLVLDDGEVVRAGKLREVAAEAA